MTGIQPISVSFGDNRHIAAVQVRADVTPADLPAALGIQPRGAIAVVGSAGGLDDALKAILRPLFDALSSLAAEHGAVCIDGGTEAGIMQLLGAARASRSADFPLIGVAPLGLVTWPGRASVPHEVYSLDANHNAFVLIEGEEFGHEVELLAALAYALAGTATPVEILAGGGSVSRQDVRAFRKRGGPVIVLEGSGRFADDLAAALNAGQSDDNEIKDLLTDTSGLHLFPVSGLPADFAALLTRLAGW